MECLSRNDYQTRIGQRAIAIWLTGLPASGKTTIAAFLQRNLFSLGYISKVLDGDELRKTVNSDLGFSEDSRMENIKRAAVISKSFIDTGIITINSFITPTEKIRKVASEIIGDNDFYIVFVDTPVEVCEKRDIKGMYKLAREGKIKDFTGISSVFELPAKSCITIDNHSNDIEKNILMLTEYFVPKLRL